MKLNIVKNKDGDVIIRVDDHGFVLTPSELQGVIKLMIMADEAEVFTIACDFGRSAPRPVAKGG